jgi:5'-methylthioadenosine phosphorylase
MSETIGIIGGSGLYDLPNFDVVKRHEVDTPYGVPSGPVVELSYDGSAVFFLARHGEHHQHLPHELNFRANIFALKTLGVTSCLSISAVGSMKEEVAPGDFLIPDQLIDWTLRKNQTFLGGGLAGYPASADPFSEDLSAAIAETLEARVASSASNSPKVHRGGAYICIEGPHLSTRAESAVYRGFGASVIGMTACPEVRLAFEAQMKFALIGMVSDYDCWHEEEEDVTVQQVLAVLKNSTEQVKEALPALVEVARGIPRSEREKSNLRSALITAVEDAPNPDALAVLLR